MLEHLTPHLQVLVLCARYKVKGWPSGSHVQPPLSAESGVLRHQGGNGDDQLLLALPALVEPVVQGTLNGSPRSFRSFRFLRSFGCATPRGGGRQTWMAIKDGKNSNINPRIYNFTTDTQITVSFQLSLLLLWTTSI